jgi:hypothetical protein
MKFPLYPSNEYTTLRVNGKLISDLGKVILEEYGKEESEKLLQKYSESKQEQPAKE